MAEEKEEEVVVIEDDIGDKESETEGGDNSDKIKEENPKSIVIPLFWDSFGLSKAEVEAISVSCFANCVFPWSICPNKPTFTFFISIKPPNYFCFLAFNFSLLTTNHLFGFFIPKNLIFAFLIVPETPKQIIFIGFSLNSLTNIKEVFT